MDVRLLKSFLLNYSLHVSLFAHVENIRMNEICKKTCKKNAVKRDR